MPQARIRQASVFDLPYVYAFELRYIREIEPEQESAWKDNMESILRQWTTNIDRMFVVERNQKRLGHYFWMPEGKESVLASIYLLPEARRQGLGTRLLMHWKADANSRGFKRLTLRVASNNRSAQALYESAGFKHTHSKSAHEYYELGTNEGAASEQ